MIITVVVDVQRLWVNKIILFQVDINVNQIKKRKITSYIVNYKING